jgi:hypothetical protein
MACQNPCLRVYKNGIVEAKRRDTGGNLRDLSVRVSLLPRDLFFKTGIGMLVCDPVRAAPERQSYPARIGSPEEPNMSTGLTITGVRFEYGVRKRLPRILGNLFRTAGPGNDPPGGAGFTIAALH